MAKQKQLGDWGDKIPPKVAEAAEVYDKAHAKAQKVKGEFNKAKDELIEAMRETGCMRCPIRNGEKFLQLQEKDSVRFDKPKQPPAAGDGEGASGGTVVMQRVKGGRMKTVRTPGKAAVTKGDVNAAQPLDMLVSYGMTRKKIEILAAACGGNTIGHFETWMNSNEWWHRDLKGFGEEWITKLQDAHLAFRRAFPVTTEDEDADSGKTVFDHESEDAAE